MVIMAEPGGLSGPHGAVGDGLLLLLAPTLSAYVAFAPAFQLIVPCLVVTVSSLTIDYLGPRGDFSLRAIPNEQALTSIANLVVVWGVTRFLRRGATQADDVSERSATLEARRRAADMAVSRPVGRHSGS